MDEAIASDAAHLNGTTAVGDAEGSKTTPGAGNAALTPSFLAGLAAAMRETAIRERDRISGVVADDAATHIEKVRSRAAIETEELRRLAEEDVQHIEEWRAQEIDRIKGEASQRIDDRRSSLDEYLKQHDAIIETEIQGVEGAVKEYEATLDRFFAGLSEETEPSAIVRRADLLPRPPDLDEVRASARAAAMAQLADAEATDAVQPAVLSEPTEAVASEAVASEAPTLVVVAETPEAGEASEAAATSEADATPQSNDDGTLPGVMDDGSGSLEPVESEADTASEPDDTPAVAEPAADPVGVMDPDAQRVPNWPAPAPGAEAAPMAPTMDNTSAAVRLLRSVAPWTAPTHAGNRGESESD